jgi:NADPH:quinone reductase
MKAVVARALGPPENFILEDVDAPPPGPGQIRVDVHVAGVSYVTALVAAGRYQVKPPLPFTPGGEFAGIVAAIGSNVTDFAPGDRVLGAGMGGGFAEAATIPATAALRIPASMSFETAAVFRVAYGTAYHALVQRAALRAGETLLVLGAAGAVGEAAIQVGKALGTRVIGSGSTEGKRAAAAGAGANDTLDSHALDWRDQVKRLTSNRGVDVVFDPVGGAITERAFRALGWRGRHLVVGFAAGSIPALPVNLALLKGAALVGVDYRQFRELEPEQEAANLVALFDLHARNLLNPTIGRVYQFSEFAAALRAASENGPPGRVLLRIRP